LSTFIKPILAFLICVLIFLGFNYLVDIELLEFVQTRFYNPSLVKSYVKENTADADLVQEHIAELQEKFALVLSQPAVQRSFLYDQSNDDIYERSRVFGMLLETTSGLLSAQFVDSNGMRLHYSTSPRDIISRNTSAAAYRNYNEDQTSLPYDIISVPSGGGAKYTMDERNDRIILSFPFYDSMDVYRGTALFSVSVRSLADRLIGLGRLKVSEGVSVIGDPPGILLGSPGSYRTDIHEKISAIWKEEVQGHSFIENNSFLENSLFLENNSLLENRPFQENRVTIDAEDSGVKFSLISFKTKYNIFFGRLVNDYIFSIPESMKIILELAFYLTFYLTLYFLLNLRPNAVTLVRNRIKRLRENLFEQLYINKTGEERIKWILELEQRREEIRSELKYKLKLRNRTEKRVDGIIDKSWDELLTVLKSGGGASIVIEMPAAGKAVSEASADQAVQELEEVEALEEVNDIDEVESLEEAEALEEVEDIGEAEALEEIEEIEEVESLEEVEEIEEVESLEEVEEIEEVESLGEVEEIEEVETLEEIEEVETLEEIEEVEALEEVEEIEEAESLEEAEEIEEVEALAEAEEIEEAAAVDAEEEIEELDELDEEFADASSDIDTETKTPLSSIKDSNTFAGKKPLDTDGNKNLAPVKKGLLALASIVYVPSARKGLLALADEVSSFINNNKNVVPAKKGLLALADEIDSHRGEYSTASSVIAKTDNFIKADGYLKPDDFIEVDLNELENTAAEEAEPVPAPVPVAAQSLAGAPAGEKIVRRGLLMLASEIEFGGEVPPAETDEFDDDAQDLAIDVDVVSPFSSMFSGLDNAGGNQE